MNKIGSNFSNTIKIMKGPAETPEETAIVRVPSDERGMIELELSVGTLLRVAPALLGLQNQTCQILTVQVTELEICGRRNRHADNHSHPTHVTIGPVAGSIGFKPKRFTLDEIRYHLSIHEIAPYPY